MTYPLNIYQTFLLGYSHRLQSVGLLHSVLKITFPISAQVHVLLSTWMLLVVKKTQLHYLKQNSRERGGGGSLLLFQLIMMKNVTRCRLTSLWDVLLCQAWNRASSWILSVTVFRASRTTLATTTIRRMVPLTRSYRQVPQYPCLCLTSRLNTQRWVGKYTVLYAVFYIQLLTDE